MDPASIREFMGRRWDLVGAQKRLSRAALHHERDAAGRLAALGDLRARALRQHPQGPPEESRQRDLADHIQLCEKLRRIADGLPRR